MEYANHLNEYAPAWSEAQVAEEVARIREAAKRNHNAEVYKTVSYTHLPSLGEGFVPYLRLSLCVCSARGWCRCAV